MSVIEFPVSSDFDAAKKHPAQLAPITVAGI
jgi:hypothetical protein